MSPGKDPHRHRGHHRSLVLAAPLALAALLAAPAAVAADRAPVFGQTGQIVLPEIIGVRTGAPSVFNGLGVGSGAYPALPVGPGLGMAGIVGYSQSEAELTLAADQDNVTLSPSRSASWSFWVAPSVDVFVGHGFSIGASVGVLLTEDLTEASSGQGWVSKHISVAAAPRVGYAVPLGRGLTFWPRLSVGYGVAQHVAQSNTPTPTGASTGRYVSGVLDLALVYQPIQRLMFKLAPQISAGRTDADLSGGFLGSTSGAWVKLGAEATAGLVF